MYAVKTFLSKQTQRSTNIIRPQYEGQYSTPKWQLQKPNSKEPANYPKAASEAMLVNKNILTHAFTGSAFGAGMTVSLGTI